MNDPLSKFAIPRTDLCVWFADRGEPIERRRW